MERWTGKVALVTGASAGIGKAIAIELCKQGMKVAALARRAHKLQEYEIKEGCIKGIKCDVTKQDEIKAAVEWIENNWGPVSVLVNNAGININEPLIEHAVNGFFQVMETNVFGYVSCFKEVIACMKRHNVKHGHIINMNSVLEDRTPVRPSMAPYVTSKHALSTISKLLRDGLALESSLIKVTNISPGFVETELTAKLAHLPIPRIKPEDVCKCVIFVLSTSPDVNIPQISVNAVGAISNMLDLPSKIHL